jgi:hypothetical protein
VLCGIALSANKTTIETCHYATYVVQSCQLIKQQEQDAASYISGVICM